MHVLSTSHFARMLNLGPAEKVFGDRPPSTWEVGCLNRSPNLPPQLPSLLDIGAGDGNVTQRLQPFFEVRCGRPDGPGCARFHFLEAIPAIRLTQSRVKTQDLVSLLTVVALI
jgi:hypothetical protein